MAQTRTPRTVPDKRIGPECASGRGVDTHILLELASALLVFIPLYAVARACHETQSIRLALAFVAFTVLEFRAAFILLLHTFVPVDHYIEELIDFGGDLISMTAFAGAFLHGSWWSLGRSHTDAA